MKEDWRILIKVVAHMKTKPQKNPMNRKPFIPDKSIDPEPLQDLIDVIKKQIMPFKHLT